MRILSVLFAVSLALTSCDKSDNREVLHNSITSSESDNRNFDNAEVPEELLTLRSENSNETKNDTLSDNLFGRFFCDRAEFYIIDNPQNEIYFQKPTSIILYYLDGELCQAKYELEENIADRLFKELGRCRIIGIDLKNRAIIESNGILIKSETGTEFNPELDNYELKWTIGDKEVKYRVERKEDKIRFIYTEKLKSYEKQYKRIEKYC